MHIIKVWNDDANKSASEPWVAEQGQISARGRDRTEAVRNLMNALQNKHHLWIDTSD